MVSGRAHHPGGPDDGPPGVVDLGGLDDLDASDDLDAPWTPPAPAVPSRRRRTALVVLGGALVLAALLTGASTLLRSPQERLERRLADALDAAGVELEGPLTLQTGDDSAGVWTGRLDVRDDDGGSTPVRIAVRPDAAYESASDRHVESLFPLVDCDTRYPLTYPGDSDTSFRTTIGDLAECSSAARGGGALVTIAWVDDGNRDDGVADGPGTAPVDRQTWLTDGRGGLVWMHNADDDGDATRTRDGRGLTGDQQRAVASAEGLLDAL